MGKWGRGAATFPGPAKEERGHRGEEDGALGLSAFFLNSLGSSLIPVGSALLQADTPKSKETLLPCGSPARGGSAAPSGAPGSEEDAEKHPVPCPASSMGTSHPSPWSTRLHPPPWDQWDTVWEQTGIGGMSIFTIITQKSPFIIYRMLLTSKTTLEN